MELRVRVGIGQFSPEDERTIEMLDALIENVPQWGPVLSWQDGETIVTMSNDWPSPLWAGDECSKAVVEPLELVAGTRQDDELIGHFARVLEVEPITAGG